MASEDSLPQSASKTSFGQFGNSKCFLHKHELLKCKKKVEVTNKYPTTLQNIVTRLDKISTNSNKKRKESL